MTVVTRTNGAVVAPATSDFVNYRLIYVRYLTCGAKYAAIGAVGITIAVDAAVADRNGIDMTLIRGTVSIGIYLSI